MRFTFHYVSISTDELLQTIAYTFIFTFHYVSISTLLDSERDACRNDLHSTMYLFQHRKLDVSGYIQTYLHSTMYLFQLIVILIILALMWIYIPLCIYFNQCPKELRADTTGIYIPLCIYFNGFLPEDVFNVIMIYIPLCIYFNYFINQ